MELSEFCGVLSNKSVRTGQHPKLAETRSRDLLTFCDLENDFILLANESINLESDFQIKSAGVNEWQTQIMKNFNEIKLIFERIAYLKNILTQIESLSTAIEMDFNKLECRLTIVDACGGELNPCTAEPQRYEMYQILFGIEVTIRQLEKTLQQISGLYGVGSYSFTSTGGNLSDLLFYHLRILENIDQKLDSLGTFEEHCQNLLNFSKKDCFQVK